MKLHNTLLPVAFFALAVFLAGCVSITRPYPDKKFYLFEIARGVEAAPVPPTHPEVMLQVKPFTISPRYEGQEFVYRVGARRYESDFYNQFFLPPSGLITEAAREWLRTASLFGAVFGATAPVRPTHHVSGFVTTLFGDYTGDTDQAVIGVQMLVTRDEAGGPVIVFQRDYLASEPLIIGGGADELMGGWNKGLADVLQRFENDLRSSDFSRGTDSGH